MGLQAGISVREFWDLTPRELRQVIRVADEERADEIRYEFDRDVRLAWQVANLTRAKRLPSLKSLFVKHEPQKPLTKEQRAERERELAELKQRMMPNGGK